MAKFEAGLNLSLPGYMSSGINYEFFVKSSSVQSLHLFVIFQIKTLDDEKKYSTLLSQLLDDHTGVVTSLAKAFHEVKHQIPVCCILLLYSCEVSFLHFFDMNPISSLG